MKKITAILAALLAASCLSAQNAWINEIHYDNTGTDADEFIEVIVENAGSYTLSDFTVNLYNGNDGKSYNQKSLSDYTVGATSGNYTIYYLNYTAGGGSIQNGAPDGMCLSYQGTPITGQFLSYEGTMTATDGPASGMTSVDIGVSEVNTPVGQSLQLSGTGSQYAAFVWQAPATATMGQLNNNQVLGTYNPDPEPSNYPTLFAGSGVGLSGMLTWTDATGAQLPVAYLIKASTSSTIVAPVDGVPEADDNDMTDGEGAWNVSFGQQKFTWDGLQPASHYYFKIFPYTNMASYINYKTDGTPPAAEANTQAVVSHSKFEKTLDPWTQYSVSGAQTWVADSIHGISGSGCAKMSGYSGGNLANEDWLISPSMNLSDLADLRLRFYTAENYGNGSNPLYVMISSDYNSGDPTTNGTWTDLSQGLTFSAGAWAWTPSEYIDISTYNLANVHVAFKYTSTTNDAPTWEVDNVLVSTSSNVGIGEATAKGPDFEIYPNPCRNWFFLNIKEHGSYDVTLVDASGRKLYSTKAEDGTVRIDTRFLNSGIYFVVVNDKRTGGNSSLRLVVR